MPTRRNALASDEAGMPRRPSGPYPETGTPRASLKKSHVESGAGSIDVPEAEGLAGAELPDPSEDHELVRRAQRGDESAFESLVRRHEQRAWRVARNLVPNDEDAQDLSQEAFVRVFKNIASFDFAYPFTTWLYRIVTNLAIDHLRRRRPATSTSALESDESDWDLTDPGAASPSDEIEGREVAAEVRDVLASLAPHFQSVLVLRELEGLPCTEIAKIVGATHVTVRWRLHRGRKLFQEEWERRVRVRDSGLREGGLLDGARPGQRRDSHDVEGDGG